MSLYIKICGLTSEAAVAAAVEAGADAIGFVFAASLRRVTPERAAELARGVPRHVALIAVTRRPSQADIDAIGAQLRPHWLQTELADLATLRLPAGVAALPVLRSAALHPTPLPARFLYEGADSGSGTTADWAEAGRLAARGGLILAGGLNAGNVAAAIHQVQPFGVDVSSGVESAPGHKDPQRIVEFIARAREAARTLSRGASV